SPETPDGYVPPGGRAIGIAPDGAASAPGAAATAPDAPGLATIVGSIGERSSGPDAASASWLVIATCSDRTAPACGGRSAGDFASMRITSASRLGGTPVTRLPSGGGADCMCIISSSPNA